MTTHPKPRAHRRRAVNLAASFRIGGDDANPAQLTDLSEAGCRLQIAPRAVAPEQRVLVRPATLEAVSGMVRWSEGEAAGVAFDGPIHPAIVDHVAGNGEVLGCAPVRRSGDSAFTDRFGRALPVPGGSRRRR